MKNLKQNNHPDNFQFIRFSFYSVALVALLLAVANACQPVASNAPVPLPQNPPLPSNRSIHIFVALCDNKYQGIVPVPSRVGNGQDPANNLYWGWGYGVRTYFTKSKEWKLLQVLHLNDSIPERVIWQHRSTGCYLVADAYDGRYIRSCTSDFLLAAAGARKDTIVCNNNAIGTFGYAELVAYVGHNGLMDFTLPEYPQHRDSIERKAIILACSSRSYFNIPLRKAGAQPLLWTSGLMGPEAYTLHDALQAYLERKNATQICNAAAAIYSHFSGCSVKAARKLLVTGWQ